MLVHVYESIIKIKLNYSTGQVKSFVDFIFILGIQQKMGMFGII